jgi:hypothetical protein
MHLACNWLSFATINLVVYNFSIIRLCVQLNVYNMNTCHKNDGINLYILRLLYLIYLHRLCIITLCASNTRVNPMLT